MFIQFLSLLINTYADAILINRIKFGRKNLHNYPICFLVIAKLMIA